MNSEIETSHAWRLSFDASDLLNSFAEKVGIDEQALNRKGVGGMYFPLAVTIRSVPNFGPFFTLHESIPSVGEYRDRDVSPDYNWHTRRALLWELTYGPKQGLARENWEDKSEDVSCLRVLYRSGPSIEEAPTVEIVVEQEGEGEAGFEAVHTLLQLKLDPGALAEYQIPGTADEWELDDLGGARPIDGISWHLEWSERRVRCNVIAEENRQGLRKIIGESWSAHEVDWPDEDDRSFCEHEQISIQELRNEVNDIRTVVLGLEAAVLTVCKDVVEGRRRENERFRGFERMAIGGFLVLILIVITTAWGC
jgi:hypothetical protein